MLRLQISVKQQDINKGIKGACYVCPIALAIGRVLRSKKLNVDVLVGVDKVVVKKDRLTSEDSKDAFNVSLPKSAINFIRKFDSYNNQPVRPFKFYLDFSDNKEKKLKRLSDMNSGQFK